MINLRKVMKEYSYDNSIFCDDDEIVRKIKYIVNYELTEIEKRVMILYAEIGSQRKLAKELDVSSSSCNLLIKQIRKKIKEKLNDKL